MKAKQWTISQTPGRQAKVNRAAELIGENPRNFANIVDFALSLVIHTSATDERTDRQTARAARNYDHAAQYNVLCAIAADIVTAHASTISDDPEILLQYFKDAGGEIPHWLTIAQEQILMITIAEKLKAL